MSTCYLKRSFRISYRSWYSCLALTFVLGLAIAGAIGTYIIEEQNIRIDRRADQVYRYRAALAHCSDERIAYETSVRRLTNILKGQEALLRISYNVDDPDPADE